MGGTSVLTVITSPAAATLSVTSTVALWPTVSVSPVSAGAGDANSKVTLSAGTVHTLVVLDGASGLENNEIGCPSYRGMAPPVPITRTARGNDGTAGDGR